MISIKRQLSTRGGKDVVPHTELTTVRSDALFPAGRGEQQEGSSKNKGGLVITANDDEAVVWEMEFDLQTESLMNEGRSATKPNIKGSTLVPSFRTPNIQLEVCRLVFYISEPFIDRSHGTIVHPSLYNLD
jgi:hypothetical protein